MTIDKFSISECTTGTHGINSRHWVIEVSCLQDAEHIIYYHATIDVREAIYIGKSRISLFPGAKNYSKARDLQNEYNATYFDYKDFASAILRGTYPDGESKLFILLVYLLLVYRDSGESAYEAESKPYIHHSVSELMEYKRRDQEQEIWRQLDVSLHRDPLYEEWVYQNAIKKLIGRHTRKPAGNNSFLHKEAMYTYRCPYTVDKNGVITFIGRMTCVRTDYPRNGYPQRVQVSADDGYDYLISELIE